MLSSTQRILPLVYPLPEYPVQHTWDLFAEDPNDGASDPESELDSIDLEEQNSTLETIHEARLHLYSSRMSYFPNSVELELPKASLAAPFFNEVDARTPFSLPPPSQKKVQGQVTSFFTEWVQSSSTSPINTRRRFSLNSLLSSAASSSQARTPSQQDRSLPSQSSDISRGSPTPSTPLSNFIQSSPRRIRGRFQLSLGQDETRERTPVELKYSSTGQSSPNMMKQRSPFKNQADLHFDTRHMNDLVKEKELLRAIDGN